MTGSPAIRHLMLISPTGVYADSWAGRERTAADTTSMSRCAEASQSRSSPAVGELPSFRLCAASVESEHPCIICLVFEPETVRASAMEDEQTNCRDWRAGIATRIAPLTRPCGCSKGVAFYTEEFDQCACEALPDAGGSPASSDPRKAQRFLRQQDDGRRLCRRLACRHRGPDLFKDRPRMFAPFRAWKRARLCCTLRTRIQSGASGQDIGYPDHAFQHSIRRFYGLKAERDFLGSRICASTQRPGSR